MAKRRQSQAGLGVSKNSWDLGVSSKEKLPGGNKLVRKSQQQDLP